MIKKWDYIPTDRQRLAHKDLSRYLLYGGAAGGGKTVLLVADAFILATSQPGNRGIMVRKIGKHFKETTLETWRRVIPEKMYTLKESKQEIIVKTDGKPSVILYGGLDKSENTSRFMSLEYSFAMIDQAEEITEEEFNTIASRIDRWNRPGQTYHRRMILTANPKQCWLKPRFITNTVPGYKFIQSKISDNPYLDKDYEANLREIFKAQPEKIKALIEGSWDEFETANTVIQVKYIRYAFNNPGTVLGPDKKVVTWDVARGGKCENVQYAFDGYKQTHKEVFASHVRTPEGAAMAVQLCKLTDTHCICVDANGPGAGAADDVEKLVKGSDIKLIRFSSQEKASNPKLYYNVRAEAYWKAGNIFAKGQTSCEKDEQLLDDLSSIGYTIRNGRILIDSKEDIEKILGRSPDRGDAYVMGLYAVDLAQEYFEKPKETPSAKWVREREREMLGETVGYSDMED